MSNHVYGIIVLNIIGHLHGKQFKKQSNANEPMRSTFHYYLNTYLTIYMQHDLDQGSTQILAHMIRV